MMQVQIFSVMAAINDSEHGIVWTGAIPNQMVAQYLNEHPEQAPTAAIQNYIYRLFNRVTPADLDTLEALNYRLPSLSVGDFFAFKRDGDPAFRTYRVAPAGFKEITGNTTEAIKLITENFQ